MRSRDLPACACGYTPDDDERRQAVEKALDTDAPQGAGCLAGMLAITGLLVGWWLSVLY